MRLGIFAKTFDGTAPQAVLDAAVKAGFSTVQYNMACSGLAAMPDRIAAEEASAIAAAARDHSVSIAAVSGTYNMIHPDQAVRRKGHERLAVLAASCHAMSTRLITLCTGTRDPDDQWRAHRGNNTAEAWRDLLASMEVALRIADQWDIDLGIEPELANVVSSAEKARQLIDDLQSPCLKIVMDPANLFKQATLAEQRRIVSAAIGETGERIAIAHAKDRAVDGSFVAAGKGVLDYPHFLSSLKAAGFNGPLVTHGLTADEAPGTAAFLTKTLAEAGVNPC
jgi:sugar phosphate isomerase/epimerase